MDGIGLSFVVFCGFVVAFGVPVFAFVGRRLKWKLTVRVDKLRGFLLHQIERVAHLCNYSQKDLWTGSRQTCTLFA